jgi:uncharacterized membrane protein
VTLLISICIGLAFLFGLVIVPALDPSLQRNTLLPRSWSQLGINVFWGFVSFFAMIAVAGLIAMLIRTCSCFSCCCQCCYGEQQEGHNRHYTASNYPYYGSDIWCCYICFPYPTPHLVVPTHQQQPQYGSCDCTACNCHGCSSSSAGGDSDGCVILLVIVLVLAVLGVIFSVIFLAFLGASYVDKYRQLMQRHESVVRRRVKDLTNSEPLHDVHDAIKMKGL